MNNFNHQKPNTKIEIGLLEIRRHVSDLYSFIRFFKIKDTNLTLFTTKPLLSQLKMYFDVSKYCEIILKKDNENVFSFLKRVENICNKKIDILFVTTIHEVFSDLIYYIKFKPRCKMILTMHHANAWLKPKMVFNIKHPIRSIDTNLSSTLIKHFIFPKFDAISVTYRPMKNYILNTTNYNKEIFVLPTTFYESEIYKKISNKQNGKIKLRIAMPGLVQEHRKDYSAVLPVIESLFKRYNDQIHLDVPGMPVGRYGQQIYKTLEKIKNRGFNISIFEDVVPDDLFDEILVKSDIILAPIRINSRGDNEIKEQYGISVNSGNVYDAIRFAKPIIVPSEFNMIKEMKSSTLTYNNSKELEKKIIHLIQNPKKLNQLKEKARTNAENFSVEQLQQYFKENVLNWLKKN
jgi:hypothetical protein